MASLGSTRGELEDEEHEYPSTKKCKYSSHPDFSSCKQSNGNRIFCKSWKRLKYLSPWIGAGELMTPLPMTGLDVCLSKFGEISIRVERDCRSGHKATNHRSVALDMWERFFFKGIGNLRRYELLIIGHHKIGTSIKGACRFQLLVSLRLLNQ
ncbi:hypothetical protein NC651_006999 [Populus alba x Populus x berolinensis]|nr:hypothetical protein NC651_006999 [Populus alba x Populus x berolinensis]